MRRLPSPPPALEALGRRGQRQIIFGAVWLACGILLTLFTMAASSSVYIVAWGPMVWGVVQILSGIRNVAKSRRG